MRRKALILIALCSLGFIVREAQAVNLESAPKPPASKFNLIQVASNNNHCLEIVYCWFYFLLT